MKRKVYILSLIFLTIDIISKQIIKNTIPINSSIIIIKNFFQITYVLNTGAAFSILMGKQLFLIILSIIVLIGVIYYLNKEKITNYSSIYYCLLIAGIIGNLMDRIIYNGVIDFLDFNLFGYDAPIFNLADTYICISVGLIIFKSLGGYLWKLK